MAESADKDGTIRDLENKMAESLSAASGSTERLRIAEVTRTTATLSDSYPLSSVTLRRNVWEVVVHNWLMLVGVHAVQLEAKLGQATQELVSTKQSLATATVEGAEKEVP